jgi:DNA-binding MarR family transcriptional regulator
VKTALSNGCNPGFDELTMARTQVQPETVETDQSNVSDALRLIGLEELLGFHLKLAQATMHRDFLLMLKDMELTQKQFAVLSMLEANPGCSQIAMANTLGTDRATMMAIVDRLQGRGRLLRSPSQTDRRRQDLYLTKEGLTLLARSRALVERHEARFSALFSPDELAQLIEFLTRIHKLAPA